MSLIAASTAQCIWRKSAADLSLTLTADCEESLFRFNENVLQRIPLPPKQFSVVKIKAMQKPRFFHFTLRIEDPEDNVKINSDYPQD